MNTNIRHILDTLPDLAMLIRDGNITFCNKAGLSMLKAETDSEIVNGPLIELVHEQYQDVFLEVWQDLLKKGATRFPLKIKSNDGAFHEILFHADCSLEVGKDVVILYGKDFSTIEMDATVQMGNALSQRVLNDVSLSLLCICDPEGISYINPTGVRLLEAEQEDEILGLKFAQLVHPDYKSIFRSELDVLAQEVEPLPLKLIGLRGTELRVEMKVSRFRHGRRDGFLLEARDITDLLLRQEELLRIQGVLKRKVEEQTQELSQEIHARIKAEETVEHMILHDGLTGLGNRTQFVRHMDAETKSCGEEDKWAVFVLDLDHFKDLNDIFGHETGDQLLRNVARILSKRITGDGYMARLGGDEFALMIPYDDDQEPELFAQKILRKMSRAFVLNDQEIYSGCSIGISLFPVHGDKAASLLGCAEMALYHAKNKGRATYSFFNNTLKQNAEESSRIEHLLRAALVRNEFELYYQPQIDLKTGNLVGAEALIRWHSSEGMVSPDRFIPIAEKTGLIDPITDWVMTTACTQAKEWQSIIPGIRIAVNLSAVSFRQADFVNKVSEVLEFTQVSPECLELEITETAIMADFKEADRILNRLDELGVNLAIDDFGMGYSSLSYLKRFPVDKLKIDKSFVMKLDQNPDDAAITAAIISMAHAMGTRVLAEGVEEKAHMLFLKERGCEEAQGFYFARPMPAEEFVKWCSQGGTGTAPPVPGLGSLN
ncbi:EAL domain-containing protein [Kiloniella laminariae]|uniref:EAL domain-containing protein n=1 Tax=Kiloniella laminariae TaxID=454162 RepID=A0ABT4LMV7_9PROT|nr:EAL domain-containing protein [Kiloniella laminariae]MCZ4282225.1 EAL domain-containing protein [Kiloniella laminariae]